MPTPSKTLIDLETKFWQSMVNQDIDTALEMLNEPSLMVSPAGTIKFDHAGFRKMAEQDSMVLTSFELSNMEVVFPNDTTAVVTHHVKQEVASQGKKKSTAQEMNDSSTWIQSGNQWQCVMHTETPAKTKRAAH